MHRNERFLLDSTLAYTLYEEIKDLPIIDFYTKLDAKKLFRNSPFTNISKFWLEKDPYKWRLMRNSGVLEYEITGKDTLEHKFLAYASALERAYLNPLYHWSHMELRKFFNIEDFLTKENAKELYDKINADFKNNNIGPRDILENSNVECIYIEEDLNDDLETYKLFNSEESSVTVKPVFCADSILDINNDKFLDYIDLLQKSTSITISGITTLATALSKRLDYFNANGSNVANHTISELKYSRVSKSDASKALKKRLMNNKLTIQEEHALKLYLLKFFLKEYAIRDMVCEMHIGVLPSSFGDHDNQFHNSYGTISTYSFVDELNNLFSELNAHYPLPKMVIYHMNRSDNEAMASLCGNFSSEEPGKLQFGGAWWFNSHEQGIVEQIETYAHHLNLGTYIGYTSHAYLSTSMVRQDYFRRILANTIANEVLKNRIPNDAEMLKKLVKDISYYNRKYFFSVK